MLELVMLVMRIQASSPWGEHLLVLDTTLEPVLLAVKMVQMMNWLEIKHCSEPAPKFPFWKRGMRVFITAEKTFGIGQQIPQKLRSLWIYSLSFI